MYGIAVPGKILLSGSIRWNITRYLPDDISIFETGVNTLERELKSCLTGLTSCRLVWLVSRLPDVIVPHVLFKLQLHVNYTGNSIPISFSNFLFYILYYPVCGKIWHALKWYPTYPFEEFESFFKKNKIILKYYFSFSVIPFEHAVSTCSEKNHSIVCQVLCLSCWLIKGWTKPIII